MKKWLLLLLLVPTLCLANIGETKEQLHQRYCRYPSQTRTYNHRASLCVYTDGELYIIVGLLDGKSVVETLFDKDGGPVKTKRLEDLLGAYGNKWYPIPDSGNSKTVENPEKTITVSYGDLSISGDVTVIHNAVTIMHESVGTWLEQTTATSL